MTTDGNTPEMGAGESVKEILEIRERQVECETRLAGLERTAGEIATEVRRLAELVRGNGERGLFGQLQMTQERLDGLQRQWRWVLGLITALVVGVAQAFFRS